MLNKSRGGPVEGSGSSGATTNKGYFATPAALNAALPVGEAGWFAVVGSTDTVWLWDVDTTAWIDTNTKSLQLGETISTAYRGDRGKTAYDHSQSAHAPANAQKNSDITKEEIEAKLTGEISTHTHAALAVVALGTSGAQTINPSTYNTLTPTAATALVLGTFATGNKSEIAIANGLGLVSFSTDFAWNTSNNEPPALSGEGTDYFKLIKHPNAVMATHIGSYVAGNDAHTKLLAHCDESGFVDSAIGVTVPGVVTNNGSVTLDTSTKKMGTGSALINANGQWLGWAPGEAWSGSVWTIDFWVNLTTCSDNAPFFRAYFGAGPVLIDLRCVGGSIQIHLLNVTTINITAYLGAIVGQGWKHLMLIFNGTDIKLYLAGTQIYTYTTAAFNTLPLAVQVGTIAVDTVRGNFDEIRISNVVRKSDTFTPLTIPYKR